MGIVIKDMDMPEGCRVCMFHSGGGRIKMTCDIMAKVCEIDDYSRRPIWCPVEEYKGEAARPAPRLEFGWKT